MPVGNHNLFRVKEQVIRDFVAPALQLPTVQLACRRFYAAKQNTEVWLRVFIAPKHADAVIAAVRPLATSFGLPDAVPDETDDILSTDCRHYRRLLTHVTRYAIDLHLRANLIAEQQALICIACRTPDPRQAMQMRA